MSHVTSSVSFRGSFDVIFLLPRHARRSLGLVAERTRWRLQGFSRVPEQRFVDQFVGLFADLCITVSGLIDYHTDINHLEVTSNSCHLKQFWFNPEFNIELG